jgi:aspartokinase
METIAVYWEPRIKTYGFQRITDLALIELSYALSDIQPLGEFFLKDDLKNLRPKFIIAQVTNHEISFIFCLPVKESEDLRRLLEKTSHPTLCRHIKPVSIVFFHGPHFGDRYGIADATFSSLFKAGVKILASGCSSASVFLVLATHDIDKAEEALAETFEVAK